MFAHLLEKFLMTSPRLIKKFITIAILVSLSCTLLVTCPNRTHAASSAASTTEKISPDLLQLIQSGNGETRVRMIVQTTPTSSSGLLGGLLGSGLIGSLLQTVNGVLVATLSNLNLSIIDVKANSAEVIAGDPSVSYVSLDTEV